jgi:sarcosine oxidase
VKDHGYEEHCLKTLRDLKIPCSVLGKEELGRHYPMINPRAIRFGLLHKDGGMIWAMRAVCAVLNLAQRRGVLVKPRVKITAIQRKGGEICGLKDSAGKIWQAGSYLFAPGAWAQEIFKGWRIPVETIRRRQLYLCPRNNRGRYRPEHFPPFLISSQGFGGFPMHIHGFMKIVDCRRGVTVKFPGACGEDVEPAFEKKCRAFLKRFIPELAGFDELEGHVAYYGASKDGDFIVDHLPGASNGFLMAGFGDQGFTFAPLLGRAAAQVLIGGKSDLNLHRFRLGRF